MASETDHHLPNASLRDPNEHTLLEDAYALLTGSTLAAIGLVLMSKAGIVTAGVAGVALLLSYKLPLSVGALFFLLTLPFFLLGLRTLGRAFLVKSLLAVGLIFILTELAQLSMDIVRVHPAFAALAGGTCSGIGILALIRHKTGVGGVNIVALYLEKRRGWNVGWLHIAMDGAILLAALIEIGLQRMGWSLLSMLAINGILIAYHRPGRYLGH